MGRPLLLFFGEGEGEDKPTGHRFYPPVLNYSGASGVVFYKLCKIVADGDGGLSSKNITVEIISTISSSVLNFGMIQLRYIMALMKLPFMGCIPMIQRVTKSLCTVLKLQ